MDNKNILIVDDQVEIYEILKKQFRAQNFTIYHAFNANESMRAIDEHEIHLILMDVMMPQENGFDLTKRIRKDSEAHYIPIIMLTAKSEADDLIYGFEVGADDYVTKPFDFNELKARVLATLRRHEILQNDNNMAAMDPEFKKSYDEHNKELQKKIYYLSNLFDISNELHAALDINKLMDTALFALISHLGAKSTALLLSTDPTDETIYPISSKGFLEVDTRKMKIDRYGQLFHYFTVEEKPKFVSDLIKLENLSKEAKKLESVGVALIAPIKSGEILEGFVLLGNRLRNKAYTISEIDILKMFNSILSVALSNASMYEKIKELSYTDGMTALHNYRFFEMRLREELSRCARLGNDLGLIIMDIDYFKNYNDTLGHQAGDEALRIVARVLKSSARNVDICCRYGGEEFAVILPNVTVEGASIFADRLRQRIEKTKFPKEEIQPNGKLTCSIGVSVFPYDADNIDDLIHKSDLALYRAKKMGRNRIIMYKQSIEESK